MLALDAKVNLDDNALYRHHDLAAMEDPDEKDPLELEAPKHNLNYIRLTGNIGAMVNGAGLAMATMDLIKFAGAEPANFLDVGGGASADMVANGFRIILADPNVKGMLINIFGGILRCDVLANGVMEAVKQVKVKVPIIVRLEGTNVEQGREMLAKSGLNFTVAADMLDAAKKGGGTGRVKDRTHLAGTRDYCANCKFWRYAKLKRFPGSGRYGQNRFRSLLTCLQRDFPVQSEISG